MNVFLVKEGMEQGQAVAYRDAGNKKVEENGRNNIRHREIDGVTSELKISDGRMIFAKTK